MTEKLIKDLQNTIKEYDEVFKETYGEEPTTKNYEEYDEVFAIISTINQYKGFIKKLREAE